MHLTSFKIENYRKFGSRRNTIFFVEPNAIRPEDEKVDATSDVAASTTLIIGKNNSGKTTIANALKLICDNRQPRAADFNISYIKNLLDSYKNSNFNVENLPELSFTLVAHIETGSNDLIANLDEFVTIENSENPQKEVEISVKIVISESLAYLEAVQKLINFYNEKKLEESKLLSMFESLLNQESDFFDFETHKKNLFKTKLLNSYGQESKKFQFKDLINLREIKANRHLKDDVLTEVFNKIIKFQFDNDKESKDKLSEEIEKVNDNLTQTVNGKNKNVSKVLREIENTNKVDLGLTGNVTYERIVKGLIKYNFSDDEDLIPEEQFGLGYVNLLNIIGEIIHYIDSYKSGSQNSRINLLFIEEPEAFMHPQMQEFFIKRIDAAVQRALEIANENSDEKKSLNCQIIITTHSSHIVNSKIHSSKSFNNINYLSTKERKVSSIKLNDRIIKNRGQQFSFSSDDLVFLQKHIKYKVSEIFFADAVVFVEGATEEALLKFYIDNDRDLRNNYICIFNINGAHAHVYFPLVRTLKIPTLVITDIDIKRRACEIGQRHKSNNRDCDLCGHKKGASDNNSHDYKQVSSLQGRETTNNTIKTFNQDEESLDNIKYYERKNFKVVFQCSNIHGYYATSLEEAFILTNYDNLIVNSSLESIKPKIYSDILGEARDKKSIIHSSYKLQSKLARDKNEFTSEILYRSIVQGIDKAPKLPDYIMDGFKWLKEKLTP